VATYLTIRKLQMSTALDPNRFPDAHETLQELIRLETALSKPDTTPMEVSNLEFWRDYLWNRMRTDVQIMVQARLKSEARVMGGQEIEPDNGSPPPQQATNVQPTDCLEVLMPELAALRTEIEALRQELASLT
jgi:hypothetical protein